MSSYPPRTHAVRPEAERRALSDTPRADTGPTESRGSGRLKKILGIVVSLGALSVIVFSVEWSKVWLALQTMKYWPIIPAVFLIALQMILRAYRWHFLLPVGYREAPPSQETEASISSNALKPNPQVTIRTLLDAIMVGNLASSILPLRAGEFIRPLLLNLQSRVTFPSAFVSVVSERFFDLSAVLIAFALVSPLIGEIPPLLLGGAQALSVIASAILIVMIVGAFLPDLVRRVSQVFLVRLPKAIAVPSSKLLEDLLRGAIALRSFKALTAVLFLTVAVWGATFASYQVFFWLFDIEGRFIEACVVTVFIALAVAAPSAPGFVGVYQLGCIAALSLFNIPLEIATAYALVSHLIQYLVTISYGAYALSQTQWRFSDLLKRRANS